LQAEKKPAKRGKGMEGERKSFVVPLLGYPGLQLTKTTVLQVLTDGNAHFETICALVDKFKPDAIFYIMDLTVEAEALGAKINFSANQSPSVGGHIISSELDLKNLSVPDPARSGRMPLFLGVMEKMKKSLGIPKAAYVIGPLTLAGEIVGVKNLMKILIRSADFGQKILEFTTRVSKGYARALVEAGADIVCLLEPTAVLVSPRHFSLFSKPYIEEIAQSLRAVTVLHICGNTTLLIPEMITTKVHGISIDSVVDLVGVLGQLKNGMAVIGNIDPMKAMVFDSPQVIREKVLALRRRASAEEKFFSALCHKGFHSGGPGQKGFHSNFILSSGCDLPPEVPLENVAAFMAAGRETLSLHS
jgi:uroporphyrinogen decarboxylase